MEDRVIRRREFLKRSAQAGLASITATGAGFWLWSRNRHPQTELESATVRSYRVTGARDAPPIVVVAGGTPARLVEQAVASLGGMRAFVSRGDVVVLKPNIGWDRVPQQAANTNPELVQKVVELCFDAGAKRVVVTDVSCNDPRRCFKRSGIANLAESSGATVLLPEERKFRDYRLNGELLTVWPIFTPIVEADKVINLPIVKHHNLSRATMGMKNWYGILGGRRNQLHQNIDMSIADLATFLRPTLTILDAYRVLMSNGPQGGNLDDVKLMKTVVAGTDPVAIDALGARFLDLRPEQIPYIRIAHERGLGNMNYEEMPVRHIEI
ncbi:MAG: DUF362 domain-containing protein [Acidobacteria bacterium]|nr:DUF362 domain-containing protein [Acidobacteriota bacterium]